MARSIILILALILPFNVHGAGNRISEQELVDGLGTKAGSYEVVKALGNCAGLYFALSDYIKGLASDEDDLASMVKTLGDTGRGAEVAADYVARMYSREGAGLSESLRDTSSSYWSAILNVSGVKDDKVTSEMQYCASINILQTVIVEMIRKDMYGFKEDDE